MSGARAWRWCFLAGVVAFACSWGFGRIPGLVACGPTGGMGPILAFELLRAPNEVAALFGTGACRSTLVAAQRTGLLLDGLGFIPSYTAFLILAAKATAARWRAIAAALLIAAFCDEIEGVLLWRLLDTLPGTQTTIDALAVAVRTKFALLGLGTLAIGVLLATRRPWVAIIGGSVVAAAALLALAGQTVLPYTAMMPGFTAAWFTLLIVALLASVAPALVNPRSPSA